MAVTREGGGRELHDGGGGAKAAVAALVPWPRYAACVTLELLRQRLPVGGGGGEGGGGGRGGSLFAWRVRWELHNDALTPGCPWGEGAPVGGTGSGEGGEGAARAQSAFVDADVTGMEGELTLAAFAQLAEDVSAGVVG